MTSFDIRALHELYQMVPAYLTGRTRWVMSQQTLDELKRYLRQMEPVSSPMPPPMPWEPVPAMLGWPIRIQEGMEGIALEVVGTVRKDGGT